MGKGKHSKLKKTIIAILVFVVVFALVFIGIQYFTKTGLFKIPGVVTYDDSLDETEKEELSSIFNDKVVLDKDVYISAYESNSIDNGLPEGEYVYDILVAVADFYDSRDDISEYNPGEYKFVSIFDLTKDMKLLTVFGNYYFDTLTSGAYFRIIHFESEKLEEEIIPLVKDMFNKDFPKKEDVFSFVQTGVTAMSRGMNAKLYEVGEASFFSENIRNYLSSFDKTHTSNESSFSDYANSDNICSDPRFITTLEDIGLDIVELTGNHNQDCGDEASIGTINIYNEHGIAIVGGGINADEAAKPLILNEKGNGVTLLAYNLSTGGATYDDTPGANQYYEENAIEEINAAKDRGDTVIIDIQYYECSAYASSYEDATCDFADSSAGDQVGFFRHLIELGADVVVGTSAHQPQTFELYEDGVIYYGLGNLFFDQVWWPGTTRSLTLAHYFYNNKLVQTRIMPTVYDENMQTTLMDEETKEWFISRLASERP